MTTLIGCILLASVASGPKIVDTRGMRLDARGVGFKVYQCGKTKRTKQVIDSSRPLRVMTEVAL